MHTSGPATKSVSGADVWLASTDANLAEGVQLRDEPALQRCHDEPVAGQYRAFTAPMDS